MRANAIAARRRNIFVSLKSDRTSGSSVFYLLCTDDLNRSHEIGRTFPFQETIGSRAKKFSYSEAGNPRDRHPGRLDECSSSKNSLSLTSLVERSCGIGPHTHATCLRFLAASSSISFRSQRALRELSRIGGVRETPAMLQSSDREITNIWQLSALVRYFSSFFMRYSLRLQVCMSEHSY